MALAPPSSQKADVRPISFLLVDETTPTDVISPKRAVTLWIRPEELTRVDPSKLYTQQTLGPTAWADSFGTGIPSITIAGHTGWNRGLIAGADDGEARFKALKRQVFDEWHRRRNEALKAGLDPEKIKLVFADALDGFSATVAPLNFTLRRSKSRPLLLQYQIAMTVLDANIDQADSARRGFKGLGPAALQMSGLDSLSASVDRITERAKDIRNFLDRKLAAPVAGFMQQTARLYRSVDRAIRAGDGIAESLITTARLSSQAGLNIFRTAAAVVGIPALARQRLMEVAGAYSNVFCVLRNAVNQQLFFPDYSPLFGSSNCSSTSGGRPPSPLSGVNPFYLVHPTQPAPPVQLSGAAQSSLQQLASADVVLSPMSGDLLAATVSTVVAGTEIA